jgi:deoxycytidylate deaminase
MNLSDHIKAKAWEWNKGYFKCVKQSVEAMLVLSNGIKIYGSNAQETHKEICPRVELDIADYKPCDSMCNQVNHAERDAIMKAFKLGYDLKDSTMYLTGHWVCCDECRLVMAKNGIKEAILVNDEGLVINTVVFDGTPLGTMELDYAEALLAYKETTVR